MDLRERNTVLNSCTKEKDRGLGGEEPGRQQKALWAPREFAGLGMLAVAPREGPAPPQKLWQKQLPGNGGASVLGLYPGLAGKQQQGMAGTD